MGSDIYRRCMDRCWIKGRDRQDERHCSLSGTSRFQGDCFGGALLVLQRAEVYQGTSNRTQQQLELEIENMGGHLNAYTSVSVCTPPNQRTG